MGGAPEAAPAEAPPGGEVTPEGFNKNDLNMLLEDHLFGGSDYMDLSKGRSTLTEINDKLKDLLG
jgi:hypothetical protein